MMLNILIFGSSQSWRIEHLAYSIGLSLERRTNKTRYRNPRNSRIKDNNQSNNPGNQPD